MNADPLDPLLAELNERLSAYVALAKTVPGEDELLDAVQAVRDSSAALTEGIAERTGQLISLHYVYGDGDDEDQDVTQLTEPGLHITVEEVLRIVDHEKLVRSAGSPTEADQPGDSPAERAVYALLELGTPIQDLVLNADRYGLDPIEGATGVQLIDLNG